MTTTTPTIETMKPCDDCKKPEAYEPIIVMGLDLSIDLPHLCEACAQARQLADEKAANDRRKEKRRLIWEDVVPQKYRETDTAHPDFNLSLWKYAKRLPIDQSLALIGPAGRSKTRVLALLAARAINLEISIGWCPANSFQWAAQTKFDDTDGRAAREWLKHWRECDILFLDDLGKHKWSETVETEFFYLIETRYGATRPTHWSMNPDPADTVTSETLTHDAEGIVSRGLDPTGQAGKRARFSPILSRLLDNTHLIPVQ